jgi:hypothetical protein
MHKCRKQNAHSQLTLCVKDQRNERPHNGNEAENKHSNYDALDNLLAPNSRGNLSFTPRNTGLGLKALPVIP